MRVLKLLCLGVAVDALLVSLRPRLALVRRSALRMSALPRNSGKVLVVGNGPVFLLAAKNAARLGYETTIVGGARSELYGDLLWSENSPADPKLTVLDVTDQGVAEFNTAVAEADGVIIAFDQEQVLSDSLLDVVVAPSNTGKSRRIVALSRNLNGEGLGPFASASKLAANTQVWAGGKFMAMYQDFEAKVKARAVQSGPDTDVVIVRAGTLKGGGPGDVQDAESAKQGLSSGFYNIAQKDLVNWNLVFDCDTRGVALTPGDTAKGPGFRAAFTATSFEAEPGDTGRIAVANALVQALSRPKLAGKDFGVGTAKARSTPNDAEWDQLFASIGA